MVGMGSANFSNSLGWVLTLTRDCWRVWVKDATQSVVASNFPAGMKKRLKRRVRKEQFERPGEYASEQYNWKRRLSRLAMFRMEAKFFLLAVMCLISKRAGSEYKS